MITVLILLLVGHALADYPLQGDFLARAKHGSVPLIPAWYALATHSLIHAGFVFWFTDSLILCGVEFVAHWAIDKARVDNRISFLTDQALHIGCKVAYVAVLAVLYG